MISKKITEALLKFRKDRDWDKFHTPKNLCAAIAIEAAELLEVFQWASDDEQEGVAKERKNDIEREIADILILITYLCHDLNVSVPECIQAKLAENEEKYPIEKAFGKSTKYDRL